MSIVDLSEKALELYEHGYVPLPLRKQSKHLDIESMGYCPLHFQTKSQKLKELAFTSICFQLSQHPPSGNTVKKWFSNFDGNLGVLAGHGGLAVLDFDRNNVFETWYDQYADRLDDSPTAKSPDGYHVFFRCRTPFVSSSLYFGRRKAGHLKSLGGYVVAPPSVLKGGKCYEWHDSKRSDLATTLEVENIDELGLAGLSPIKAIHDKLRNRGLFELE